MISSVIRPKRRIFLHFTTTTYRSKSFRQSERNQFPFYTSFIRQANSMADGKIVVVGERNIVSSDKDKYKKLVLEGSIGDDGSCHSEAKTKREERNKEFSWSARKKLKKAQQSDQKPFIKNFRNDKRLEKTDACNAGSYACKKMQEKFGITVEEVQNKVDPEKEKAPKRKVSLLIAFLGTHYTGMQMNIDQRTIQAELELALWKGGLISNANFGHPGKYSWSNSARTDKGVHSCAQVCSAKILMPTDDTDIIRNLINAQLPNDIRILDVLRTPKSFCAKTARDEVRYQYMVPSFLLATKSLVKSILKKHDCLPIPSNTTLPPISDEKVSHLQKEFVSYRASPKEISKFSEALGSFVGTHNFHNYTSGKKAEDPSSVRYMKECKVLPAIEDKYGMEWIPTTILGQSFLLHQIRKMIFKATEVICNDTSMTTMKDSFTVAPMRISVVPPHGLFLDMSYYSGHNKRNKSNTPLDWHSNDTEAVQRWRKFKEQHVMTHLMDEENSQGNFIRYLYSREYNIEHPSFPQNSGNEQQKGNNSKE